MSRMKQIFILFILGGISPSLNGQMYIHDPLDWWGGSDVNIENLEISVKLEGAFSEVEYTYEISASEPGNFDPEAQLEYVHEFFLPSGAVFNDSWLWIDDYISKGVIYGRQEGTEIYESIVERRQDPSILTKQNENIYSFKVYPLFADSTRKVKISYLTPLVVSGSDFFLPIKLDVFYGAGQMHDLKLTVHHGQDWVMAPLVNDNLVENLLGAEQNEFIFQENSEWDNLALRFTQANEEETTIEIYEDGEDKYYQLAFYPDLSSLETPDEHHMFVLDYNESSASVSKEEVLNKMRTAMLIMDEEKDYFNVSYFDFGSNLVFDQYVKASQENIDIAISELSDNQASFGSSLVSVFTHAINFILDLNLNSDIILVSSDIENGEETRAAEIADAVIERLSDLQGRLYVIDIGVDGQSNHYIDGSYYTGNQYLYNLLVQNMGGEVFNFNNQVNVNAIISSLSQEIEVTDLFSFDVGIENGFTYDEYTINGEESLSKYEPIIKVGKYVGEFPNELNFLALIGSEFVSQNYILGNEEYTNGGPLLKKLWTSQFILENEFSSDFSVRQKVIEVSKEERLLSHQTVFLCLELDSVALVQQQEGEAGGINSNDELEELEVDLVASPNPFIDQFVINLELSEGVVIDDNIVVELINITGVIVADNIEGNYNDGKWSYEFNAENLEAGIYFVRVRTDHGMKMLKVIKVQ